MDSDVNDRPLFHMTHLSRLESIVQKGLLCDAAAQEERESTDQGQSWIQIGDLGIKQRRAAKDIPGRRFVSLDQFVPFYFAPRTPMLHNIHSGRLWRHKDGQKDIVYLVTSIGTVRRIISDFVFTDRNAIVRHARFSADLSDLDDMVDEEFMRNFHTFGTPDDFEDAKQRRMAEFLVRGKLPWSAIELVATRTESERASVNAIVQTASSSVETMVKRAWYFND